MVAHVNTVAFHGIEARNVDVQVHIAAGLPAFTVVGLPDKAVSESRERVRAALGALGLALAGPRRYAARLVKDASMGEGPARATAGPPFHRDWRPAAAASDGRGGAGRSGCTWAGMAV